MTEKCDLNDVPSFNFLYTVHRKSICCEKTKKEETLYDCPHEVDKLSGVSNEISYFEAHFDDAQQNEKDKICVLYIRFKCVYFGHEQRCGTQ